MSVGGRLFHRLIGQGPKVREYLRRLGRIHHGVLSTSGPQAYWEELLQMESRSSQTELFTLVRINIHLGRKQEAFDGRRISANAGALL